MQVEGAIWRVDSHRGFPKSAISDGGPLCVGMGLLCLVVHSGVPFCLGAAVLSAWEGLLCLGYPLWRGGHFMEISLLGTWSSLPGEAHFGVSIRRGSFLLGDGVLCALRSPF